MLGYFLVGPHLLLYAPYRALKTAIQAPGFRSLADGEDVEYTEGLDDNGRKRALKVTGPGGQDVQGKESRNT